MDAESHPIRRWERWLGSSAPETAGLRGPRLSLVRGATWFVFCVALIVYTADLFALWDETHRLQHTVGPYDETRNFFGLRYEERRLLTGSLTDVPAWYPVSVVARQVVLDVLAVGIALLILTRRPRHGMAHLTILFILLGPHLGQIVHNPTRFDDTTLEGPFELMGILAFFVFLTFVWTFPDGRFRGSLLRFFGAFAAFLVLVLGSGWLGARMLSDSAADSLQEFLQGFGWMGLMVFFLVWGLVGIGLQIWRYRRAPMADRRLARWNLAFLVAVPLWFLPFQALHGLFTDSDVRRYSVGGFVWEQIHETLYLAAPVLLGIWVLFLVRRQGWWDFQTLWNRSAVYGIAVAALGLVYVSAFGIVSLAASPLTASGERIVAVVAATATVAFAYGPLLGSVRAWVDRRWFPGRTRADTIASEFGDSLRTVAAPDVAADQLLATVRISLDTDEVELWNVRTGS